MKNKLMILTALLIFLMLFTCSCNQDQKSATAPETLCEHSFGEWETVQAATCKEEGKKLRTCSKCSAIEEETTPKSNIHSETTLAAVAPTCGKDGLTEGKYCSVCSATLVKQTTIPATNNHTLVIDSAVAATCKTTGLTEGSHCSVCKKTIVKQHTVQKIAHAYENRYCSICQGWQASTGLEFTKNSTGYSLSGLGSCRDSILVIPSTYNGKPVNEICTNAICYPDFKIRRIVIPDSIKNIRYSSISISNFCIIDLGKNSNLEEQSFDLLGGCEIINRSSKTLQSTIFQTKKENAPYTINNSGRQMTEYTDEGLAFLRYNRNYYLCDYIAACEDLVLPTTYKSSSYILASRCFINSNNISRISLGTGVSAIGECAFANSSLTYIDLQGNVSELPSMCFTNCKNLTSITIPNNITSIQNQCFYSTGLNTVTIGKNVTTINVFAFDSCSDLDTLYFNAVNCTNIHQLALNGFKKLVIGSPVQSIPSKFMKGNTTLESITFEDNSSCASIGAEAFDKASITEIILPKSLTHIYAAFEDCTKLAKINILCENLQHSDTVFYDCGSSGDGIVITVASNVSVLPSNFLKNCKIKALTFDGESKCKTIQASFSNGKISNVILPAAIESFDKSLFDLKTLSFEEGNENYTIKDSCLISLKDSKLIAVLNDSYVIPEYVTIITKGAFYESGVKHIYIPDTVLTMEDGSLCCSTVESISLPFIGTDRNTPKKLLELFGSDVQHGWIQIDLNAGTTRHERYYVPAQFSKLIIRDTSISNGLVGLSMLKEIHISDTVAEITPSALKDCNNLTTICFGGTQEQWDNLKASGWLSYVSMNVNLVLNAEIDT